MYVCTYVRRIMNVGFSKRYDEELTTPPLSKTKKKEKTYILAREIRVIRLESKFHIHIKS